MHHLLKLSSLVTKNANDTQIHEGYDTLINRLSKQYRKKWQVLNAVSQWLLAVMGVTHTPAW